MKIEIGAGVWVWLFNGVVRFGHFCFAGSLWVPSTLG